MMVGYNDIHTKLIRISYLFNRTYSCIYSDYKTYTLLVCPIERMAVLGFRSGNRRWAIITGISAAIIIFSIFYLGIHWLSDMLAGTLLGLMASSLGIYLGKLTDKKATHSLYYNKMTG